MRNAIKYFYNIYCTDIIKAYDNYKIIVNNDLYYLIDFDGDINYINEIYKFLISNNIYCHQIISNKDNQIITNIDNKNYIFIKINIDIKKISFENIFNFNVLIDKNKKCNWYDLWCQKIDYYEYHSSQFKKKYPVLYDSFSYYNGLSENAISLVNSFKSNSFDLYLNHRRIYKNSTTLDFYNPINMVLDVKVRDICEYFKNQFFYVKNPIEEIKYYLNYGNLSNDEAVLFFSRLMYPSYYFDMYDKIVQEKISEDKITIITEKANDFELFLKEIYIFMSNLYALPEIEWLIKT